MKASSISLALVGALLLLALSTGCGGGGGGGSPAPTAPPPAPADPAPVTPTAAEELDEALQGLPFSEALTLAHQLITLRDPEGVLAAGLAEKLALTGLELTDISFHFRQMTISMWRVVRDYLDQVDRAALSDSERLSFDIFSWQADAALAGEAFLHYEYQASYFLTSVPRQTERFFSDLHPRQSRQDARDYLIRLALVDDKIDQLIDNLREMESEGVVEPQITLNVAVQVHRGTLGMPLETSPYYGPYVDSLSNIPGIGSDFIDEFRAEASRLVTDEVVPAYTRLTDFMEGQLARAPTAIGVGQFPAGAAYYQERLKFHTTTDMTPETVHQLGLDEVARVHAEMRERFDALAYPGDETLEQLFQRVRQDGGTIPADQAVATYEALIDDAELRMASLFQRLPETEVVVIGGEFGGFYIRASLDGTRPGAFYAGTNNDQPYYLMPTLAYHEAMPGHHMQIALAQETDLPLFRQQANFTAFSEGWALYAERLAGEQGWYENDIYGDLGRLYFEGLRAARLVVDTGIHHLGWDFETAVSYFQENVGTSRGSAESNIGRYSIYTGQATAYMIGMLKILELRERMRDALGPEFDITAFHSLVLDQGPMPLAILEQQVDELIALQAAP